jgi:CrcB protein
MRLPRHDRRELVAIFVGGVAGALARVGLAQAAPHGAGAWPWATFLANMVGALLLGYFVTRLQERLPPSNYPRPFLGTGLCGALTTYSTFSYEILRLLEDRARFYAAAYVTASLLGGFGAVGLGWTLGTGLT